MRRCACFLALLASLSACDEAPAEAFDDDSLSESRMGPGTQTVRLATANLAGWNWDGLLAENGLEPDAGVFLGWMQILYLQTLEGSGPTLFNVQEAAVRRPEAGSMDWPEVMTWQLGNDGSELVAGVYETWYQRINPDYGNPDNDIGTWGNTIATNADVQHYEEWDLDLGCGGAVRRGAQAMRIDVGGVDVWSVNVHLEFCREGEAFAQNACNLSNLLSQLDELPESDVVFVGGDFNVGREARQEGDACPGQIHPAWFDAVVRSFRQRGFIRLASDKVDHAFVRDPEFVLSGARSSIVGPYYEADETYRITDHSSITVDLDVGGAGMSPAMMPLYVAFD